MRFVQQIFTLSLEPLAWRVALKRFQTIPEAPYAWGQCTINARLGDPIKLYNNPNKNLFFSLT